MEDDYQKTLKGKIKILYQLEKWQDVNKLCEQYAEKYGIDVEIDMIRFKSERHLNKTSPADESKPLNMAPKNQTPEAFEPTKISATKAEEEQPLLLTADIEEMQNPAMLILDEIPAEDEPQPAEEKSDYEPFPQANELIITDPFDENEPRIVDPSAENEQVLSLDYNEPPPTANMLVITDPYAEDEPVFRVAGNEPPLILDESSKAENVETTPETQAEEISIVDEIQGKPVDSEIAFDFTGSPANAFNAEPTLDSAAEAKPQAETLDSDPVFVDKPSEVWHEPATAAAWEKSEEDHLPMSEPDTGFQKKIKPPKKFVFNFKYLLVLILPLVAAVALWLALSGKLNLSGDDAEAVSPASVVAPRLPAARRPARKVTPAAPVAQIDENEKLVNEKISQANDFIKKGDILNALAVVREAKKIKITEPLSQLEELIANKIRDDQSRAAEQKQAELKIAQSEDQVFAKADTENTIEAWQNFLKVFPQSAFAARARNKIAALEKKAAQTTELDLQARIKQAKKLTLRSDYLELNQAELNAVLLQLGKPSVQFEQSAHGGEKVIIDFSSGLMWILLNKPMAFDKASWWANRIYAGYSGWRLPTVDESQSLQRMDPDLYAGLSDFAVWTGDGVSDKPRSVWTLRLPQGQFNPEDYDQVYYVWAVRKAVK